MPEDDWCPECDTMRAIVETSEEDSGDRYGDRVERWTAVHLECGHTLTVAH